MPINMILTIFILHICNCMDNISKLFGNTVDLFSLQNLWRISLKSSFSDTGNAQDQIFIIQPVALSARQASAQNRIISSLPARLPGESQYSWPAVLGSSDTG